LVWDVTGQRTSQRRSAPAGDELVALWADLGAADAARAYRAMQALLGADKQAVALLKSRLQAIVAADGKRIERLVSDLDSERFAVRQKAEGELKELGEAAGGTLRAVLAGKPSLELRRRVEGLLEMLDIARSPERLRELRAVEVLGYVGTAEAHQVLQALAKGSADARLTQEAQAALLRRTKLAAVTAEE
jgi:hypothetical protein